MVVFQWWSWQEGHLMVVWGPFQQLPYHHCYWMMIILVAMPSPELAYVYHRLVDEYSLYFCADWNTYIHTSVYHIYIKMTQTAEIL